jgi:hypothetical protein
MVVCSLKAIFRDRSDGGILIRDDRPYAGRTRLAEPGGVSPRLTGNANR